MLKAEEEGNTPPSVYVGETCRSIYERGLEHWKSYEEGDSESHILKHHVLHHGGEGQPLFHLKPVKFYRTALSRQIGEAVRIGKRGCLALNSKAGYNRCEIPRLTLGEEAGDGDFGEDPTKQDQEIRTWLAEKRGKRIIKRVEKKKGIKRIEGRVKSRKHRRVELTQMKMTV